MTSGRAVPEDTTRVSGRRIFQLLLDLTLVSLLSYGCWALLVHLLPGAGFRIVRADGWLRVPYLTADGGGWYGPLAVLVVPVVLLVLFVLVPALTGRTPMMVLFGLRILRTDGSRVSAGRHALRSVLLLLDVVAGGLLGLIVMLSSRRRQRIGDHAADTVVVQNTGTRASA